MVEIKNIHGQVIAQVENPEEVVRDIDFRGWDLSGAWFYFSDLRGADFREADLRYAHFENADLEGANFSDADLSWSDILDNIDSYMYCDINFEGADLPMRPSRPSYY